MEENHRSVWVDTVVFSGETLVNGDFEQINEEGIPLGWDDWESPPERVSISGQEAYTGKTCVLVWHDRSIGTTVDVEAGKKYTLEAYFKLFQSDGDKEN